MTIHSEPMFITLIKSFGKPPFYAKNTMNRKVKWSIAETDLVQCEQQEVFPCNA